MEAKFQVIREQSELNQWKNTQAVIKWFKNNEKKKELIFLIFDVVKFYPSISKKLLVKALKWARDFVEITDEEIEVIMAARKAMLYMNGEPWSKKGGEVFDVGMGFFNGAEICEFTGLYILAELKKDIEMIHWGW